MKKITNCRFKIEDGSIKLCELLGFKPIVFNKKVNSSKNKMKLDIDSITNSNLREKFKELIYQYGY